MFSGFVSGVKGLISGTLMTVFRDIPRAIKDVFVGAGSWLLDAGRKIIDGLLDGIKGAFNRVKDKLGELTSLLPDWKGPAQRDARILRPAGRKIIEGLDDGLADREPMIEKRLKRLTNDIGQYEAAAPGISRRPGVGAAPPAVNATFNATSHDPEIAARYFAQELRRLLGVI